MKIQPDMLRNERIMIVRMILDEDESSISTVESDERSIVVFIMTVVDAVVVVAVVNQKESFRIIIVIEKVNGSNVESPSG